MKIINEAFNVVREINEKIYNRFENDDNLLILNTDGFNIKILFRNTVLWRSYDDERVFIEDANEYEPLEHFIVKELKQYIINLKLDELFRII